MKGRFIPIGLFMYIVAVAQTVIRTPSRLKAPRMCMETLPVTNCFGSASASYDSTAFLKWSIYLSTL